MTRRKLRHGRAVHEGTVVNTEYGQACPFFFTREGASLSLLGQYRGGAAFLIAGGPSFAAVDRSKLSRVWTMTLNNSIKSWRSQANVIVDEPSHFSMSMWLDPRVQKFVPMGHFEKPLWDNRRVLVDDVWQDRWEESTLKPGDCPNVVGYRRNEKFHAPRWLYEETLNWGNHAKYGGGRSVLLPAMRILFLLGFRRVYLLGVDLEMTPEKKYHFAEERTPGSILGNMSTYAHLQAWFMELQPYFLKHKFIVHNCNPASRLTAFPFMPYEEAIAEATAPLGDFEQERTTGMYRKIEEKATEGRSGDESAGTSLETPIPRVAGAEAGARC
jgi:hypothetical protein